MRFYKTRSPARSSPRPAYPTYTSLFSLWLPEQFETRVRATAFAFCTSVGRFIGAGINFLIGAAVLRMATLGIPIACTAIAFLLGLLIIPFAPETKGQTLPK
jgi:hypothetical protein